jgi:hypothetical protein
LDGAVVVDANDYDGEPADAPQIDGPIDTALVDAAVEPDAGEPCADFDPPWALTSWARRRELVFDTVPAHYSVMVDLMNPVFAEIAPHTRADYFDLRVVRDDGQITELDRVVVEFADWIRVWFMVDTALNGGAGDPRYFLYYDNPDADPPPRQPHNVFPFVDFFERADLGLGTRYAQVDLGSTPGNWRIENGQLVQDGTWNHTGLVVLSLEGLLVPGFELVYRWLSHATYTDSGPLLFWSRTAGGGYYIERRTTTGVLFSEPDHSTLQQEPMPMADDTWHTHVLRYYDNTLIFREDGDSQVFDLTPTLVGDETVGVATYHDAEVYRFDNLRVRVFVSPEPEPTIQDPAVCDDVVGN